MKTAEEWLNEVGKAAAEDMFVRTNPPGARTEAVIKAIQSDARAQGRAEGLREAADILEANFGKSFNTAHKAILAAIDQRKETSE